MISKKLTQFRANEANACTYADRATLSLGNVEVFTDQLSTLRLGAEGDSSPALTQPAGVHAVHLSLRVLLPIVSALGRD